MGGSGGIFNESGSNYIMSPTKQQKKKRYYVSSDVFVCLMPVLATFFTYWQVRNHYFISLDDDIYITNNFYVKDGLTVKSFSWLVIAGDICITQQILMSYANVSLNVWLILASTPSSKA